MGRATSRRQTNVSQFPHVGTPAATHRGHIRCGGAAYRPPHPTPVILVLAAFAGSAWLVSCGDSAVGPAPPPPPPPNRAPVLAGSIPAQTVAVGETAVVDVSAYFTDPDGDALSYAASSSNPSVAVVSTSGATVMITAVAKGSVTVTVTATDPGGLTATQTLEATVPNRAPEARGSLPDQTVQAGQTATLDVSPYFTDADGDALSYEAASDASSVATASVSGSDVTVTGEAPGSATITVTATDPGGLSAIQTFEVTVDAASGGLDLNALFAPPTADEITQVKEEWDTRTPEVSGVRPELDDEVPAGLGSVRVRILSHTVGGHRHYGAVVTPVGAADPGSLPVILYAHGGDDGVNIDQIVLVNTLLQFQGLSAAFVVPSYRSEPLQLGDEVFLSEGPPSPWDRDVDDTISLLSVALEQAPELDEERVAILGLSRGGGVGLLTAARDKRIKAVVEFFGPTDLFDEYAREIFEEALEGKLRDLPGLDYLNEILLLPWKLGVLSDAEARLELVRRSGVYFVDRLPPVQIHHGTEDAVVAVSQAYRLIAAMKAAGKTDFEEYIYAGGTHDYTTLLGAPARTAEFLRPFLFELGERERAGGPSVRGAGSRWTDGAGGGDRRRERLRADEADRERASRTLTSWQFPSHDRP